MKNSALLAILSVILSPVVSAQTMAGGADHLVVLCNDKRQLYYSGGTGEGQNHNQLSPVLTFSSLPFAPPAGTTVKSIASGWNHILFLLSDGKVYGMGDNFYGQLGDGSKVNKISPVEMKNVRNAVSIGTGSASSYAVLASGTVMVSGNNGSGQLGMNTLNETYYTAPQSMFMMNNAKKVAGGYRHAIVLDKAGKVWIVGSNASGQLGDSARITAARPFQLEGMDDVMDIAANGDFSLFLKNDGTVWATGNNTYGQLGDSTNMKRIRPVKIPALDHVVALAAGEFHSLFLKDDGTVWACGINNFGQLGTGDFTDYAYPVQISGLTNVVAIAAAYNQSMFLTGQNELYVCGYNNAGQLGLGNMNDAEAPVKPVNLMCSVSTSISMPEEIKGQNYTVFPVPAADEISILPEKPGKYQLQLAEATGRVVQSGFCQTGTGSPFTWPLNQLKSGVYILTLTDQNHHAVSQKILISQN